ncbi:MAG: phosphatase PAP2 family protein [Ilumatobacteraceae bacterium]
METCADVETAAPPHARHLPPHALRHPKPAKHAWLRELGIVLGFYYVYQTIRSLADVGGVKNRAHGNAHLIVSMEKSTFLFHEQSIQQAFLGATWFIKAMNVYYGTLHFIITAGLLVWLYAKRHGAYRRMRNLLGATTGLALIGYWAFPLAPPRLYLQCDGNIPALGPEGGLVKPSCFVDTLDKVGGLWNYQSSAAKAIANAYAAMPSLHFGWALWCAIVIWQQVGGRKGHVLAVLYPALTLFAIVVTANHYFLDAVGGAIILGGGLAIGRWSDRRRLARDTAPSASLGAAT